MRAHLDTSLTVRPMGIETQQEYVVYMHRDCHVCRSEGFEAQARVLLRVNGRSIIATLNVVDPPLAAGNALPSALPLISAMMVGFAGYGVSLALFVIALRHLGTARTGAYFSVAPLFGVVIALLIWSEIPGALFWLAAALMALGVWLHLRERHEHEHVHEHEPMEHTHAHRHDEHHQHEHDFPWDGKKPHVHAHRHERLVHKHPHYPDIHHRHTH